MSALLVKRRELKNVRLYAVPLGDTVDAIVVSSSTWPDASPATNYTDFQFEDIETLTETNEYSSPETFWIPAADGAYYPDDDAYLVRRKWTGKTHKTNNLIKQLQHALLARPAVGTAAAPGALKIDYLEVVLLMETQLKTGVITERTQVLARFRLKSAGDASPKHAEIEVEFEQRISGNNTYLLVA